MRITVQQCRLCKRVLDKVSEKSFCNQVCADRYVEINSIVENKKKGKVKRNKKTRTRGPRTAYINHRQSPHQTSPPKQRKFRCFNKGDGFYNSNEWRQLRYLAIMKYGRRCMSCGLTIKEVHVDHIKPRSKYPKLSLCLSNLQILCKDCNLGKGAWDEI